MKRKTLDQYPAAFQEQIVSQLHPKTIAALRAGPTPRGAKAPAAALIPAKQTSGKGTAFTNASGYPLNLWLDYRVPSLNTIIGGGRWTKAKHAGKAKPALAAALAVCKNYPRQGSERLHVLITCYVIRLRDADNICPKFLIDLFREAGLLRNDDPSCMALTVNPEVRVRKRNLEGTKVTIVPALP
jgi:hypothetical protein